MIFLPKPIIYLLLGWLAVSLLTIGLIISNIQTDSKILPVADQVDSRPAPQPEPIEDDLVPPPQVSLIDLSNQPAPVVMIGASAGAVPATTTRPLEAAGLIGRLNQFRITHGRSPIANQMTLSMIAEQNLSQFILERNYLIHLAGRLGYDFSFLAALSAEGYFIDEAAVVDLWAKEALNQSILLNDRPVHLGLAINSDIDDQGQRQSKVVVILGRPRPNCSLPDPALLDRVARYEEITAEIYQTLTDSASVELVGQYQAARTILQATAAEYNSQARQYNNCLIR